jgi:hypothetical protein
MARDMGSCQRVKSIQSLLDILWMHTTENMEFLHNGHYCYIKHAFWHTFVDGNNLPPKVINNVHISHAYMGHKNTRVKDSHYFVYQLDSK